MDADPDALATALYVRVDDALKDDPGLVPWRRAVRIALRLSDAELVTVAVMQALLGFTSETRARAFTVAVDDPGAKVTEVGETVVAPAMSPLQAIGTMRRPVRSPVRVRTNSAGSDTTG